MFESLYERISAIFSISVGFLIGDWSTVLTILILFMIMDYITGWVKAIKTGTLNSTVARWGIFTKFLMFIPIILSHLIDNLLLLEGTTLTICVLFYICSEGLSICENLVEIGVPLPEQLVNVLQKIAKDNNNKKIINNDKSKNA